MLQQQQLLETNSSKHKWENLRVSTIISGKTADGTSLLKLFLIDYTKLFKVKVNPSCPKCINNYHTNYKLKLHEMDNNCDYKLKKMYAGIPLQFGSSTFLTNTNLTNELAEILIANRKSKKPNFKASDIFEKYPVEQVEVKEVEVVQAKPKKKRNTRKKRE